MATRSTSFGLHCRAKSQTPSPREISTFKIQKGNYSFFEIIEEKISVSWRASSANLSQADAVAFAKPASTSRKNNRLSFASFRQILTRIKKSFLLSASSASIQLDATEPEARTNCRTSSQLLIVLGNSFTNARTDSAN